MSEEFTGPASAGRVVTANDTSAPVESSPEAAAVLRDAGWRPHDPWGVYTRGPLVMGFDHSGSFHAKNIAARPDSPDTPDDPVEAARWLVAQFPKPMADNPLSLAAGEPYPQGLFDDAHAGEQIPEHEAHGETGEEDNVAVAAETRAPEFPAESDEGAGYESDLAGQVDAGSIGSDAEMLTDSAIQPAPIDADFSEHFAAIEGDDLADPPALEDLGAEILADEPEAPAPETPQDRFIGLDDLDRRRSLRIGDVVRIAAGKYDAEELARVNAHISTHLDRHTGAYTGDDPDTYQRFVAISAIQSAANAKVAFLLTADREQIEQFDPEAGWPE